jgi:beta-glucosidase
MFPQDFLWGVATASYQIEGASLEDGRGECIWHRFSHTPGKVLNGDTGDVACDHYHRYREDVQIMKDLGVRAYRFSVSWPRVIPAGTGAINLPGLDFYDRLVDELLAARIVPVVTLYHWDLPQALQDKAGWANPQSVQWFTDYADLMTQRLGDRVKIWATHNEPWVVAFVGNFQGRHAPGLTHLPTAYRVAHNLLLSHAAAVGVIRRNVANAQAGIVLNTGCNEPASSTEQDRLAVRQTDGYVMRWFLDPLAYGKYPADIVELLQTQMPEALDEIDLEAVKVAVAPLDFLGVNYYAREVLTWDENVPITNARPVRQPDSMYTKMGWEVHPDGLRKLLVRFHHDYPQFPAFYVTENGAAFEDPSPADGVVHDPQRVAYYDGHIRTIASALAEGVPLKGYFAWSLLDNFEWGFGYDRRFGIVHVDFKTLKRTLKQSALWYKNVIQANGVVN